MKIVKTKNIKQTVLFGASPHAIYEALMDSRKHTAFTHDTAHISRSVGGKFTAYGGYIQGTNKELVPDKKIVQEWRSSEWPEGYYSEVTFWLDAVKTGTKLSFQHKGVPDYDAKNIAKGWKEFYWDPMKKALE